MRRSARQVLQSGAIVLLLLAIPAAPAQGDEQILSGSHAFPDGLTVANGTTLVLEDATIDLGGLLLVEPEGRLEMRGQNTIDGGGTGYLRIFGSWNASGGPHVFTGLSGYGMSAIGGEEGGLQVHGPADLAGLAVRDSGAGLVVFDYAVVSVRESEFTNTGIAGVASFGRVDASNVFTNGSLWGVTGRGVGAEFGLQHNCRISVSSSHLGATGAAVGVNACDAMVTDSVLRGGNIGVDISGGTNLTLRDLDIRGHRHDGIELSALPGPDGLMRPRLDAERLEVEAGPGGGAPGTPRASNGIDAQSAHVRLKDVTLQGHSGHGIQSGGSHIDLEDVRLWANGGYGIAAARGVVMGIDRADFGSAEAGTLNGMAAANVQGRFHVALHHDGNATDPAAHLHIFDGAGALVFEENLGSDGLASADVLLYSEEPAGASYLGPFKYEVQSSVFGKTWRGDLPAEGGVVSLDSGPVVDRGRWIQWGLIGGGVLIILGATAWPMIRRRTTADVTDSTGNAK